MKCFFKKAFYFHKLLLAFYNPRILLSFVLRVIGKPIPSADFRDIPKMRPPFEMEFSLLSRTVLHIYIYIGLKQSDGSKNWRYTFPLRLLLESWGIGDTKTKLGRVNKEAGTVCVLNELLAQELKRSLLTCLGVLVLKMTCNINGGSQDDLCALIACKRHVPHLYSSGWVRV